MVDTRRSTRGTLDWVEGNFADMRARMREDGVY